MTQEDRWQNNYDEVMRFVKTNRRNLSKYEMTERRLYTWVKHNRKLKHWNQESKDLRKYGRCRMLVCDGGV